MFDLLTSHIGERKQKPKFERKNKTKKYSSADIFGRCPPTSSGSNIGFTGQTAPTLDASNTVVEFVNHLFVTISNHQRHQGKFCRHIRQGYAARFEHAYDAQHNARHPAGSNRIGSRHISTTTRNITRLYQPWQRRRQNNHTHFLFCIIHTSIQYWLSKKGAIGRREQIKLALSFVFSARILIFRWRNRKHQTRLASSQTSSSFVTHFASISVAHLSIQPHPYKRCHFLPSVQISSKTRPTAHLLFYNGSDHLTIPTRTCLSLPTSTSCSDSRCPRPLLVLSSA